MSGVAARTLGVQTIVTNEIHLDFARQWSGTPFLFLVGLSSGVGKAQAEEPTATTTARNELRAPPVATSTRVTRMKLCPYCSGEMEDAAVVCNHCGRDWKTGVGPSTAETTRGQRMVRPLWPWACLAVTLFSAGLIANCYFMQRVMH